MLQPSVFSITGGRLLHSGNVHGLVKNMNRSNCDCFSIVEDGYGEKWQRYNEGIAGGDFVKTESSCFESTDGGWDVGICRKARLEGCLSHFFKWAVSSGFSFLEHVFRSILKERG